MKLTQNSELLICISIHYYAYLFSLASIRLGRSSRAVRYEMQVMKSPMIGRNVIREEEGACLGSSCRGFGVSVLDSLLPEGVPVPCSLLIAADVGTGSEFLAGAMLREHLRRGGGDARVLWLSFENFVDDLRGMLSSLWVAEEEGLLERVRFVDCYSSQIGVESKEVYNADPSNLPALGLVTSTAISEVGADSSSNLLVILDSLSLLVQMVGLRASTEFFKTLVGRTRHIKADLLTTLNRSAFRETTLSTFAGITDIVIELTINDDINSTRLRLRKARDTRHIKDWLPYEIDFESRTLTSRCERIQETMELTL